MTKSAKLTTLSLLVAALPAAAWAQAESPLRILPGPLVRSPEAALATLLLTVALVMKLCASQTYKSIPGLRAIPAVFLVYFVPMVLNTVGLFDGDAMYDLYAVLRDLALPMSLVLLLVGTDLPLLLRLGPKVLAVMLTASLGVVAGGVAAFALTQGLIDDPDLWKGVGALAGSWIGGSANMIAAKEALECPLHVFTPMTVIDVVCGYGWMIVVMALAGIQVGYDKWNRADRRNLEAINARIGEMHAGKERPIKTLALVAMLAAAALTAHLSILTGRWIEDTHISLPGDQRRSALVEITPEDAWPAVEERIERLSGERPSLAALDTEGRLATLAQIDADAELSGTAGLRLTLEDRAIDPDQVERPLHFLSQFFNYLAIGLILASLLGLVLSFTPLRGLEHDGASDVGYALLFMVLAVLGGRADLNSLFGNGWYLLLGVIWIGVFAVVLFLISKVYRAPLFLVATASQANIGGAVSAPIVAGAYQPNLAVVGVLMAVIGQVLGTFLAIGTGWLCSLIAISP